VRRQPPLVGPGQITGPSKSPNVHNPCGGGLRCHGVAIRAGKIVLGGAKGTRTPTFSLRRHRVRLAWCEHREIDADVAAAEALGATSGHTWGTGSRLSLPRAIDNQPTPKQEGDDRCCSRSRRELCSWQPIERRLPVPPVGVVAAGAPRWRHARDARAPDQAARSDGLCSSALPPLSRAASAP
jgi:hypothetical protein